MGIVPKYYNIIMYIHLFVNEYKEGLTSIDFDQATPY